MIKIFDLRLRFAIASFGLIGLICAVSAFHLANFVSGALLERESQVSQEFLQSIVRAEGQGAFATDRGAGANQALDSFSLHLLNLPGFVRANIYAIDQTVIWSTERSLIGKRFDINPELRRALDGERVTEVKVLGEKEKLEHVALGADASGHFIEAYIPLRSPVAPHPVIAVVEFYKLPAALNRVIAEGNRIIWLSAAGAALLLFSGLYGIVRRGARLIERQQAALSRLEAFGALGQMAGAVAHSLRNPMANIRTSAELWHADPREETREVAGEIMHEVDRMDRYVRDLLAYARAENFELRSTDPLPVVEAAASRFAAPLQRHGIAWKIEDRRDRPARVLVDAALLEQALASVLSNAIEAMPGGGRLTARIERRAAAKCMVLAFSDTGAGIPAHVRRNVAREYFTTKAGGLGLGLALAIGIIERFDGRLRIESEAGRGTTVEVSLPEA